MKKLLLSLALFFALVSQGQAQNPTKKDKIKNLFAVMHQDSLVIKTFDNMASSMMKNMSAMFSDTLYTNHGIDATEMSKKFTEKILQKSKEYSLRLINEDMVDIYDKYFSVKDIDDFTTFYQSEAGQKMLNRMPDITKDLMAVMTEKYQKDFQESFIKDVQEITEQLTEKYKSQKN